MSAARSHDEEKAGIRMEQATVEGELAQVKARLDYVQNYSKGVARKAAAKAVEALTAVLVPASARLCTAVQLMQTHDTKHSEAVSEMQAEAEEHQQRLLAAAGGKIKPMEARPQTASGGLGEGDDVLQDVDAVAAARPVSSPTGRRVDESHGGSAKGKIVSLSSASSATEHEQMKGQR